jgi:hypothetical protein
VNWYGYCLANPLRYIDPSGLDPFKWDGAEENFVSPGLDSTIRDVNEFLEFARDSNVSAMQNSQNSVSFMGNLLAVIGSSALVAVFPDNIDEARQVAFVGTELSKIPLVDTQGIISQGKGFGTRAIQKIFGKKDNIALPTLESNGVNATRVRLGDPDLTAVIGRNMDDRVKIFGEGSGAEVFSPSLKATTSARTGDKSLLMTENTAWANKLNAKNYTVYDTGLDPKYSAIGNYDKGPFYTMETKKIFGD